MNWISTHGVSSAPSSKHKDLEINKDELDIYADYGRMFKQISLPSGCYLVTGWFASMMEDRVYIRLGRVPVDSIVDNIVDKAS